jgi:hypothetical protein
VTSWIEQAMAEFLEETLEKDWFLFRGFGVFEIGYVF